MSHLKYSFLFVLWATVASQQSFVSADQNLTAVIWEHAVNSQDKLNETLHNEAVNMIEGDVTIGIVVGDKTKAKVSIMAHPPNDTSDLSLENFMNQVDVFNKNGTYMKGVKLDFKSNDACEKSMDILRKYSEVNYTIWLNADILKGPGGTDPAVNSTKCLAAAKSFEKFGLSLGWTTDANQNVTYTDQNINDMKDFIEKYNITAKITFSVRAQYAAESIDQLKNLTGSLNGSTLTIWSHDGDDVNIEHLRNLIRTVGLGKTYIDVPKPLLEKLSLDSLNNGSPTSTLVFPLYVLSLIVGLRHVL